MGPSPETCLRLISGIQALERYNAEFIVLSGSSDGCITEAEAMYRTARDLGVEESKIIVEPKSRNTWEHTVELNKLLKNKQTTIGISTSALHINVA